MSATSTRDHVSVEVLANLSHELRTPLATILNGVQILRQTADTKGPIAAQTLDMLERQAKQVIRIIEHALDGLRDESENAPEPPQIGRPLRILVLEDDREGATSLARLLRLWGHEVRVSYDGPSALRIAAEAHPEVALLDIGLPGMDGYEVAQRLRERMAGDTLLIALTGFGQIEDMASAREAGFDLHLTKPVDPKRLRRLVAEIAVSRS